jgi:hypothetical protein
MKHPRIGLTEDSMSDNDKKIIETLKQGKKYEGLGTYVLNQFCKDRMLYLFDKEDGSSRLYTSRWVSRILKNNKN